MKISVNLFENKEQFVASCPELEINCYGDSKDEATRRIKEVLSFYLKSAEELGLEVEKFENISIEGNEFPFLPNQYGVISKALN